MSSGTHILSPAKGRQSMFSGMYMLIITIALRKAVNVFRKTFIVYRSYPVFDALLSLSTLREVDPTLYCNTLNNLNCNKTKASKQFPLEDTMLELMVIDV